MKQLPLILLLILFTLFPLSLLADEAADLEVVVTADRMETEETDTTATVSVITADDIAESGASNIVDVLESLPGVQFRSYSGPAEAQISMGGFGENSYGRVVVLVDGRLQNNPDMKGINWLSIPLESIERIEVLHGGGGVLYGSGAVGGVVNIITRETDTPVRVDVTGSYGSFNTHKESTSLGASNALGSLQVGGSFFASDGYRDRSASTYANASLAGKLYPTDLLSLGLNLNYTRSFYEMPGGISQAQFDDDPTQAGNPADESLEHEFGATATGDYALSDASSLELLLGYNYKNIAPDMASWGSYADRLYNTFDLKPKFSWTGTAGIFDTKLVSGVDLQSSSLGVKDYSDADRTVVSSDYDVALFSGGGYVDTDLSLRDNLGLSTGVRYDAARISARTSDGSVDDYKDHTGIAWSAGLRWNPTPSSKLYLRHERIFRYPFTDEQFDAYAGVFLDDLEAEQGYLYETGGFYAPGKAARIDLRAYLMDMQDEIAYVGTFPSGKNENYQKTRRIGAEGTVTLSPAEFLKLTGTYGYVLPYFTNGTDEGNQIPLVSNHEVEGGLTASLPYRLEASVDASYRSGYYQSGDTANALPRMDDYVLLNAGLRWRTEFAKGNLLLKLTVDNLLDVSYAPYAFYSSFYSDTFYYPANGRSITLSGTYSM